MDKVCVVCSKVFHVPKYRDTTAKYCSRDCQNNGNYVSINKKCPSCEETFSVSNSRANRKFCSEFCRHNGKNTLKDRRRKQKLSARISRGTFTGKTLRKFVFSQKEAKCEACGYHEFDFCIDVHHKDENSHNNVIDNLICLCAICHRKVHKGIIECP